MNKNNRLGDCSKDFGDKGKELEDYESSEKHICSAFDAHDSLFHFLDLISDIVDGFVNVVKTVSQDCYLDLDVNVGWLEH